MRSTLHPYTPEMNTSTLTRGLWTLLAVVLVSCTFVGTATAQDNTSEALFPPPDQLRALVASKTAQNANATPAQTSVTIQVQIAVENTGNARADITTPQGKRSVSLRPGQPVQIQLAPERAAQAAQITLQISTAMQNAAPATQSVSSRTRAMDFIDTTPRTARRIGILH